MLIISTGGLQSLQTHAERCYPEECCGLLLGIRQANADQRVIEVRPVVNAWSEAIAADLAAVIPAISASRHPAPTARRDRYAIDPRDLLQAQRYARDRNLQIIGIYHSHPDHPAIPSETDRLLAWPEYSYLILSVEQGRVTQLLAWQLDELQQFQAEAVTQLDAESEGPN